jgi:hypothetical protein
VSAAFQPGIDLFLIYADSGGIGVRIVRSYYINESPIPGKPGISDHQPVKGLFLRTHAGQPNRNRHDILFLPP